jgi:CRISPR-associated endonuclease Csy4
MLDDYLHVSAPRPIPEAILKGYVAYSRIRHDHGREKLIRRRMKRHGLTREQAQQDYADYQRNPFPECPFVLLSSKSTGSQKYPLYLKQIFLNEPGKGHFNTYGINPSAAVEFF